MKYLALLISLAMITASCNDDEEIPVCIDDYSAQFGVDACPGSGDLTIWSFDGEEVFCFNEGTCVTFPVAEIYDDQCNLLCILGGTTGNNVCGGLIWDNNAQLLSTVLQY